jgi:hemoglobin
MAPPTLTEDDLNRVVEAFYARVRADAMLGPIFNGAIHDWPAHLVTLQAFWSSVMLTTGRYKGQPMMAHARHAAALTPATFERWLALWRETTDALLPADAAAAMQEKAARIAESLMLGVDFYRNRALGVRG